MQFGRLFGRNPLSVVDSGAGDLRQEDSGPISVAGEQAPRQSCECSGVHHECTGFSDLPKELKERIFTKLLDSSRKTHFAVSGVSQTWRSMGQRIFFSSPWDSPHLISHPNQLFCLSPRTPPGSRSGLLKCFIQRDPRPLPHTRRFTLHLGKDPKQPHKARFLLCALQRDRHETLIFLNSRCEGPPCARLTSSFLFTSYSLELGDGLSFLLDGPEPQPDTPTSPRSVAAAAATAEGSLPSQPMPCCQPAAQMPQLLLSLRYHARIRGLMQPRRMDAALPNPAFTACHRALPQACRLDGGSGSSINGSTASTVATPRSGRPSLEHFSSVAVLEKPPTAATAAGSSCSRGMGAPTAETSTLAAGAAVSSEVGAGGAAAGGGGEAESRQPEAADDVPLQQPQQLQQQQQPAAGKIEAGLLRRALQRLRLPSSSRHPSLLSSACRGGSRGALVDETTLPVCLHNKAPHWNDALRCWCLNFRGRVKLASVKNFQLVRDGSAGDRVVMQFGRVEKDAFIMDFNPTVLSAVQAFAISLSTFDSKLTL